MNLFRSEEHVLRWSLYQRAAEDYIMPVAEWAKIFSGPLFRRRLSDDYLSKADAYLEEYHRDLMAAGKASPYWQYPWIVAMDSVRLARHQVVGDYTRSEEPVLNTLKDARNRIEAEIGSPGRRRRNHLIWAAPGTGKTYFVQQTAAALADRCSYLEINLAKAEEREYRRLLGHLGASGATICLIDEIDAQASASWPYEALLPALDALLDNPAPVVVVMAGSSGFNLEGMSERIALRPKGKDLLSRVPAENRVVIPPMTFTDRVLIVLSQIARASSNRGVKIDAVEKLGLYYIALNNRLGNARQLQEFVLRAVERVPPGDNRLKYDHLFEPGDPENKRFYIEVSAVSGQMVSRFAWIESQ